MTPLVGSVVSLSLRADWNRSYFIQYAHILLIMSSYCLGQEFVLTRRFVPHHADELLPVCSDFYVH